MALGGIWHPWGQLAILPPQTWERSILALYVLVVFLLLLYAWPNFQNLTWRRFLLFVFLIAAGLISNNLLVPEYLKPYLLPIPDVPAESPPPFAPLLADLPIAIAGALLGPGPALLVGLFQGLGRAFMTISVILDPFNIAFYGFVVGLLLQQDFGGKLFHVLRQPVVALPTGALLVLPLGIIPVFAHVAASGLAGLDYAVSFVRTNAGPHLLKAVVAGVLLQLIYYGASSLRAVQTCERASPFSRTLRRQLFWLFAPLILLFGSVLIYVVASNAIRLAKARIVEEMARDANSIAEDVPYFVQTGQGLLAIYAADEDLRMADTAELEQILQVDLRTVVFFDQLILLDSDAQPAAAYPPLDSGEVFLASDERLLLERVLDSSAIQISAVHHSMDNEPVIAFLAPAEYGSGAEGIQHGALLGRTRVGVNPVLRRLLDKLRWTHEQGEAFVVDERGHVVIHSDPAMLLAKWEIGEGAKFIAELMGGRAYETRDLRDNSRALVYALPVPGYPWTAVIELPYALVLEDAITTVVPVLLLQTLLVVMLIVVIPIALRTITRPVTAIARAAARVAAGEMDGSVPSPANDELGQIATSVNELHSRLTDQRSTVETYLQSIAATADMTESRERISALLDRVLQVTGAKTVRLIPQPLVAIPDGLIAAGNCSEEHEALDCLLASRLSDRGDGALVVPDLANSEILDEGGVLPPDIGALLALTVRLEGHPIAVLWLGYESRQDFSELETHFLAAIASCLALLIENVRLTHRLHLEQGYLTAVLASTSDAVLICDRDGNLCLVNPAVESILGMDPQLVAGNPVWRSGLPQGIAELFTMIPKGTASSEREVVLEDGRVIYAFVSLVPDDEGAWWGRVVVLRDISSSQGAGTVRASLVSAFSEHLRTPLTLIRGYATMMPLVGELGDRQRQYLEKILLGVGQVAALVDDLQKMSVAESGMGLKKEPTGLGGVLIEAVDELQDAAAEKGVTLRLEPAERMAVVLGDRSLLHQAVVNLIDNGVKYTPSGGSVTVSLQVLPAHAIICVADTGIGIDRRELPRIFERFYRSARPEVAEVPGAGLGLAIVKSVVEWHGGKVWVESETGQGSKIYVGLPLEEGQH